MRSLFLIACLSLFSVACTSNGGAQVEHHPDRPACMDAATELEDKAHKEVRLGVNRLKKEKRAMHYDLAMGYLRDARQLYEDELLSGKGTPESRRSAEIQIERINEDIQRLHDEKPL